MRIDAGVSRRQFLERGKLNAWIGKADRHQDDLAARGGAALGIERHNCGSDFYTRRQVLWSRDVRAARIESAFGALINSRAQIDERNQTNRRSRRIRLLILLALLRL